MNGVNGPTIYETLRDDLRADRPVALATVVDGPHTGAKLLVRTDGVAGGLGDTDLDRVVERDARGELAAGASGLRHYGQHGEAREGTVSVFIESFAPPPRMLVFGAVDFTAALTRVAKVLGYHVTVCDAREVFATPQRFPVADEVVVEALDVIETGDRRTVTFGYSDDEAFAVGLTCGGTIHLFIEPLDW